MFKLKRMLQLGLFAAIAMLFLFAGSMIGKTKVQNYPPGVHPERIILTWNDVCSTTQAVTWRTSTVVKNGYVQWTEAVDAAEQISDTLMEKAITESFRSDVNKAHYHKATMSGLEPNTEYLYRVGDGGNWSEWFQFRTSAKEDKDFSFLYFGDLQNGVKSHCSRIIRKAYASCTDAAFLLFGGDLVDNPRDNLWGEWFESGDWIYASVPVMAAAGNHEYKRELIGGLGEHWNHQFNFPGNGPKGLEASVFYFDYQGTRFIVLDTEGMSDGLLGSYKKQAAWLEETLQSNSCKWVVVTLHHPLFSNRPGRENKELKALFKPIFDKYDVDLVLQGHDHTYGRTGFMAEEPGKGPVYVISVAGTKMYEAELKSEMQRIATCTQLYQRIDISKNSILYSSYTATGQLYDRFQLQKDGKGNKQLIEMIPDEPEHLNLPKASRENRSAEELEQYKTEIIQRTNQLEDRS